ncbi:MAG: metallophosphoesterase family protein [Candidatus Hodarchaeales archaeon]|jgi:DNA repair exonuclease SbcCD nuclease subunit
MNVKFAHVSDCHLGAWRKETLNQIGYDAFNKMIDTIIEEKVNFVIISGDLYDTSNPKVDVIDLATKGFKRLYDAKIPVYGIMGSHDFSPSDRSMVRPLISAELFHNVSKPKWIEDVEYPLRLLFFQDEKTSIKLTGMRARKRSLELDDYQRLDRQALEEEDGEKIFLLHTMLSELKPKEYKEMESGPKSILPRDFLYYAGGHLHKTVPEQLRKGEKIVITKESDVQQKIVYPGVLYPVTFRELEQFLYGGFCIVEGDLSTKEFIVHYKEMKIYEVIPVLIDANNKSVQKVRDMIGERLSTEEIENKVIMIRIAGELTTGKSYEINANEITQSLREKGAYEVLINKAQLTSREYEAIKVVAGATNEQIEERLITEHAQKSKLGNLTAKELEQNIHKLIEVLGRERKPDEAVKEYTVEMVDSFLDIMGIQAEEDES